MTATLWLNKVICKVTGKFSSCKWLGCLLLVFTIKQIIHLFTKLLASFFLGYDTSDFILTQ